MQRSDAFFLEHIMLQSICYVRVMIYKYLTLSVEILMVQENSDVHMNLRGKKVFIWNYVLRWLLVSWGCILYVLQVSTSFFDSFCVTTYLSCVLSCQRPVHVKTCASTCLAFVSCTDTWIFSGSYSHLATLKFGVPSDASYEGRFETQK